MHPVASVISNRTRICSWRPCFNDRACPSGQVVVDGQGASLIEGLKARAPHQRLHLNVDEIRKLSKFCLREADEFFEIGLAGIRSTKTHSKKYGARRSKT